MTQPRPSLQAIQHKLALARSKDADFDVFGADSHHYHLSPPCSEQHIAAFERDYGISLPECYRSFISQIGNGGNGYQGSGAGPFYGIYALADGVGDLGCSNSAQQMQNPCLLDPTMTEQAWAELAANLICEHDDEIAEAEFEVALQTVFGGLMILGTQGCNYYHALVLNGPYRGRVVNLSLDFEQPKFCYEPDFLSWYQRWLDEIISGDLMAEPVGWFGYQKGGRAEDLLSEFQNANTTSERKACLTGLQNKQQLSSTILAKLQQAFFNYPEHREQLCQIICKSDYGLAHPLLAQLLNSQPLGFLQCLHWYGGQHSQNWRQQILQILSNTRDFDSLCFAGYLMEKFGAESAVDFANSLLVHTRHEQAEFRLQAYYFLGQLSCKKAYRDTFIAGLFDADLEVQRTVLQAISGWTEPEFLPGLSQIARRYPEEQNYILSNLSQVLQDYGLSIAQVLETAAASD